MSSAGPRRLLREWKTLMKNAPNEPDFKKLFYVKPQDSNFYIWHILFIHPATKLELYFVLFINYNNVSNANPNEYNLVLRCLTANPIFPINKPVSIQHLSPILKSHGFVGFLKYIWQSIYAPLQDCSANNSDNNAIKGWSQMCYIWNRVMCKTFKVHFPELLGTLQQGDYSRIKEFYKRLRVNEPSISSSFDPNICVLNDSHKDQDLIACDNQPELYFERSTNSRKRYMMNDDDEEHDDSTYDKTDTKKLRRG